MIGCLNDKSNVNIYLFCDNRILEEEYEQLRIEKLDAAVASMPPHLRMMNGPSPLYGMMGSQMHQPIPANYRDMPMVKEEVLIEARALRQHKGRLEARMEVLEKHNRQLENQLKKLVNILENDASSPSHPRGVNGNGVVNGNHGSSTYMSYNGHRSDGKRS